MHIGHHISGVAHVGLIVWLLLGPLFESDPLPFQVTNVTAVSEAEYAALVAVAQSPNASAEVVAPETPDTQAEAPPATPAAETPAPETPAPAESSPAPDPESVPEVPEAPTPPAQVDDAPPPTPAPPAAEDVVILLPETTPRPAPRPAPRVAPQPVQPPDPEVRIDDQPQEEVTPEPSETAAPPQEEQEATSPEEASTEIVTEADEVPSGAPERSVRPRPRPANRPAAVAEDTPRATTPEPAAEAPAPATDSTDSAINDALAEALGGSTATPAPTAAAPSGPPLTGGEKEALVLAVQDCWVVDVGSQAANVTVVVGMELENSGRVLINSIRMIGSEGGDTRAVDAAFQTARRAIIRCQGDGYDLPKDKFDQWREIEMTFNPERMRIR